MGGGGGGDGGGRVMGPKVLNTLAKDGEGTKV